MRKSARQQERDAPAGQYLANREGFLTSDANVDDRRVDSFVLRQLPCECHTGSRANWHTAQPLKDMLGNVATTGESSTTKMRLPARTDISAKNG